MRGPARPGARPDTLSGREWHRDADAVGLSILSGAHMTLLPRIIETLGARGAGDVLIFAGGIIPEADITPLKKAGVAEIFLPGTSTQDIIDFIHKRVAR